MTDTSRERVEAVARVAENGGSVREAAALLRALADERDGYDQDRAKINAQNTELYSQYEQAIAERDAARAEVERMREALRLIEHECQTGFPLGGPQNWERVATRAAGYAQDALAEPAKEGEG